jgi:uridine kinase
MNNKTLVLVSGSLRTFKNNIKSIPPKCDIAVYSAYNEDDTYFNDHSTDFLFEDSRVKLVLFESNIDVPEIFNCERKRNLYKQWYKLNKLFSVVSDRYDIYIRMRPDILLLHTNQLEELIKEKTNTLRIPYHNDRNGINDQLCIGSYNEMKQYCSVFELLIPYEGSPCENLSKFTSEEILKMHISNIPIERIRIDYKLILSYAKVISISGDSGSGKSTLCDLIKPLFLFDKLLEFETDRYHKWERNDEHWKSYSHLNPESNYLEKLKEDTFNLKIGNTILAVDYDHSTGKFTEPHQVNPMENILLCGLHTLYSHQLRELSDIKIFMDTDDEVKKQWKIHRDVNERGRSLENVLNQIEQRKTDYEKFIMPQKAYADIIINYKQTELIFYIRKTLINKSLLNSNLNPKIEVNDTWIILTFRDNTINSKQEIERFVNNRMLPIYDVKSGYSGIIQYMILTLLYK